MAIALSMKEVYEYVLEADRKKEPGDPTRTVFTYRPLTPPEAAKLDDKGTSYGIGQGDDGEAAAKDVNVNHGTSNYLAMKACLTGWRNFADDEGNPVPFETQGVKLGVLGVPVDSVTDNCLARLHPDDRRELGSAIRDSQTVTVDDVKNS